MNYKNALTQYIDATNSHDFQQVEKMLHKDAHYWFTDKTCASIPEIKMYFEHAWRTIEDEIYQAKNIQWIAVDEHTATCIYNYHYKGYYEGRLVSGSGRATNVFVQTEDGKWRLIHEHLSSL
ncbi:DUF4440 domain-containing protein [Agaribacter marinus]|uniref:Nuclear transport factor 2 family protein n=1 Tax=Virgibacillus salarius TaxID=447199 RepID=A0A941DUV9_9BACI|nr:MULTISPECIES: nuclear transport factor 2 family protein [Bacillaceae]MBR7797110.1 nuclear transport factor 2 family protein [Virgibacillus salarius]MDY7044853.1 nuclear transport factor 2 family protein [Virgibacillus sp. M23]NAZ09819.1 DUF4440 domain-containing protein [Agaribacter marinus]WBX81458.1 nuclear transport factor 2 family protein [Virgibacillus salarius]